MPRLTNAEKLAKLQNDIELQKKRLETLKDKEKKLLTKETEKQRKERTRRLIQNGAIAEQYLNCENFSPEDFESHIKVILHLSEIGAEVEAALGYTLDSKTAMIGLGDFLRSQEARGKWATKAIEETIKKEEERIAKEKELETAAEASNKTNSNLSNNIIDDKPW